jgi:hypothetical protein
VIVAIDEVATSSYPGSSESRFYSGIGVFKCILTADNLPLHIRTGQIRGNDELPALVMWRSIPRFVAVETSIPRLNGQADLNLTWHASLLNKKIVQGFEEITKIL